MIDHAPILRAQSQLWSQISGCTCGWEPPPGVDSEVAFTYHVALEHIRRGEPATILTERVEALVEQRLVRVLDALTDSQRDDVMGRLRSQYCDACWRKLKTDERCQCWNDEEPMNKHRRAVAGE